MAAGGNLKGRRIGSRLAFGGFELAGAGLPAELRFGDPDSVVLESLTLTGEGGTLELDADACYPQSGPALLQVATSWHQARRKLVPILLDTAVLSAVAASAVGTVRALPWTAATVALTGLVLGLWRPRSPLETQGIAWYTRRLLPVVLVAALAVHQAVPRLGAGRAAAAFAAAAGCLLLLRATLWQLVAFTRRRGLGLLATLVVAPEHRLAAIENRLRIFPEAGLRFEAHYAPAPEGTSAGEEHRLAIKLLGSGAIDHVLCLADQMDERVFKDLVCQAAGKLDVSVALPIASTWGRGATRLGDLTVHPLRLAGSRGSDVAKRAVDVATSALLVLGLSPLLALIALAIRLEDGGPAIFKQRRVGRGGKTFTIYKFRSMVVGAEDHQAHYLEQNVHRSVLFKLEKDPRVTKVGAVIRRLCLDELPNLINVLKGDMSLVGPRPLAVNAEAFATNDHIRHMVAPGITGLWQVNGANALAYPEMLELDLAYVASRSLGLDLQILARTLPEVLIRRAPF